ncbi:MAG: SRPBCC domain-containing protein [Gemmatimonadaceae bacterium]
MKSSQPTLVIERTFNAPRDLVWEVWSDSTQAKNWWGPTGFTLPFLEMDQRVGGKWRAQMRSPDGTDMWQHGVYREIVPPEKTAYTLIWDADPATQMLVSVVFKEKGAKTQMTFTQEGFKSAADREGHKAGWSQTFDRLATYLEQITGGAHAGR